MLYWGLIVVTIQNAVLENIMPFSSHSSKRIVSFYQTIQSHISGGIIVQDLCGLFQSVRNWPYVLLKAFELPVFCQVC